MATSLYYPWKNYRIIAFIVPFAKIRVWKVCWHYHNLDLWNPVWINLVHMGFRYSLTALCKWYGTQLTVKALWTLFFFVNNNSVKMCFIKHYNSKNIHIIRVCFSFFFRQYLFKKKFKSDFIIVDSSSYNEEVFYKVYCMTKLQLMYAKAIKHVVRLNSHI